MKLRAKDIAQIALFAALTAIGAFLKVPVPVIPFTLQAFFVAMSGVLLGSKKGALSQILYVLIGLAGFPIFTQGGGITYIFKPSFGYLAGFILGAYLTGFLTERLKSMNFIRVFLCMVAGRGVIYLIGLPYLYLIYNFYIGKDFSVWATLYNGMFIFLPGDLIQTFFASVLCLKLLPILKKSGSLS